MTAFNPTRWPRRIHADLDGSLRLAFGKMINVHPSLLPDIQASIRTSVPSITVEAGATVHYVTGDLDGDRDMQGRVAIEQGDDASYLPKDLT